MTFDIDLFIKRALEVTTLVKYAHLHGAETKYLWDVMLEANNSLSQLAIKAMTSEEISELARMIVDTQKKVIEKEEIPYVDDLEYYNQGRLLIYFATLSGYMGTAEIVSEGFFNFWDYPPYSTWVYWFPSTEKTFEHLLAWIPPEFIWEADEAADLVAEAHIVFATEKDFIADYKSILANAGLLI